MTREEIDRAARRFAEEAESEYGKKLKNVIMFGSCARGDWDNDSDLDIMILLDVGPNEIPDERGRLLNIIHRLDPEFDYEVLFAPVVQSEQIYRRYADTLPFYQNVEKEGIKYA